jgi:methylase of polypeptide subunit release factors
MDIRTALKLGIAQLRAAHVPSDTLAAELLLLHATGRTRTSLYSHPEDDLTESESQNAAPQAFPHNTSPANRNSGASSLKSLQPS